MARRVYTDKERNQLIRGAKRLQEKNPKVTLNTMSKVLGVTRNMMFELFESNNLPYYKDPSKTTIDFTVGYKKEMVGKFIRIREDEPGLAFDDVCKRLNTSTLNMRVFFKSAKVDIPLRAVKSPGTNTTGTPRVVSDDSAMWKLIMTGGLS